MPNILVTGGAGYIGSHACKALARAGYTPITYDNLSCGHEWAVKWGPFERGDTADRDRLDALIEHYRPQAIMHFAAHCYVGESVLNPGKYYRNNVAGTLTLLEAMRAREMHQFIFSSSAATYGIPEEIPIPEDHPCQPINPYGRSKLMIEQMLSDFDQAHGVRYVSLRYFNAAGADPEGEIGEDHDPETHLIPLVLDAALGRNPDITIFGDDYDTPDGTCIRDYIHVSDLADAHVLALNALERGGQSAIINLGIGKGFSVRQVIETCADLTGRQISRRVGPRRPGDPARLVANADKAMEELRWEPRYDDLKSIVETAWEWTLKHFGG